METSSDPPYRKVSVGKGMLLLKQSKLKLTGYERLSSSRHPFWVWMGTGEGRQRNALCVYQEIEMEKCGKMLTNLNEELLIQPNKDCS